MRHSRKSEHHHTSVHHATKTHVVTNTQLMIAVAAAFLAGGLAFVTSPNRQPDPNSCSVVSMEYGERCRGNRYKGTEFTCSDGTSLRLSDELCRTTSKIQRMVEEACASRQCAAPVAPANRVQEDQPRQAADQPIVQEALGCELTDVRFFNRCGRSQYQGIDITCSDGTVASPAVECQSVASLQDYANNYCGQRACNVPRQVQENTPPSQTTDTQPADENTQSDPNTLPAEPLNPFVNNVRSPDASASQNVTLQLMSPLLLEKNGPYITVRAKIQNTGAVDATSDAKYTVSFLDGNGVTIVNYVFNLNDGLRSGSINYFSSSVTFPLDARSVVVTLDSDVSNGQNATLTTIVPPAFYSTLN